MQNNIPPYYKESALPLSDEETKNASKSLISYPIFVRGKCDPDIPSQQYGLISYRLFETPQELNSKDKVYGFFNMRGTYRTYKEAEEKSIGIVKFHDSKHSIKIAKIGNWHPITESISYVDPEHVVDIKPEKTLDDMDEKQRKDSEETRKKIMKEIHDKEENMKNEDIYDDPNSIKYYTMKTVTEIALTDHINYLRCQLKEYESKRKDVWNEMNKLENNNAKYKDMWLDTYNDKRKESGIGKFEVKDGQFDEYIKYRINII